MQKYIQNYSDTRLTSIKTLEQFLFLNPEHVVICNKYCINVKETEKQHKNRKLFFYYLLTVKTISYVLKLEDRF